MVCIRVCVVHLVHLTELCCEERVKDGRRDPRECFTHTSLIAWAKLRASGPSKDGFLGLRPTRRKGGARVE